MRARVIGSLAALGLMAGCGGGSSPSSPTTSTSTVVVRDGGAVGASGATVTLTAAGASPKGVVVGVGQTVTFVNNDSQAHEIASDPHPRHGTCPSIESALGAVAAGQTKVTHAFANAGSCGYHDHRDAANAAFLGTITVQ